MNVKIKMTALLLALLLLLGTLVGCGGYLDPLGYLKDAAEKTLKQTLVGEVLALLLGVSDKGSLAVDFGGTDLVQGLPEAAQLKLWIDAEDRKLAANGTMTLKGQQYDLAAYLNETEMAVNSAAFLGSNTLGVDFLTLKDDLKTSIFSNNSGTAFANPAISAASAERVPQNLSSAPMGICAAMAGAPRRSFMVWMAWKKSAIPPDRLLSFLPQARKTART